MRRKKYDITKKYGKDKTFDTVIAVSIMVCALFFVMGFFVSIGGIRIPGKVLSNIDFFIFGVLGFIGPVGFYDSYKQKRKKDIENKLPEFLRDIANATASGMTIFDAIKSASQGDYGKLTPELKAMVAQLSWGISVKEALTNFAERLNTNEARRLAITINKALEIGGNTASVFNAAAKELDQIKRVEQQRNTEMSMYSIVIFVSFFVFLGVILIIDKTIFTAIFELQGKMAGKAIGNLRIANIDPMEVKNMFLTFMFVQSLGGGMLGGFMTTGRISSGVRYGFILVVVSIVMFKVLF